jgi:hypothetical protein
MLDELSLGRHMRSRLTLAALVLALPLAFVGCAGSPGQYDQVNATAKELHLGDVPGLLESDHFGEAPRVEGDPPTYEFIYRDTPALRSELEARLRADSFSAYGASTVSSQWRKDEGSNLHILVRISTLKPNTSFRLPNNDVLYIPSDGALLVGVSKL